MAKKNRKFADDAWAIWIDGDDTSTVYINDWINPKKGSFADLAIRIRGIKESTLLSVYVPFALSAEEIEDVSLKLSDEKVLRATFSATCIFEYMKNDCTSEIAYNGKTIDLIHISKCGFSVSPLAEGSLITVDLFAIREFLDNNEGYFLIRFPHKTLNETFKKYTNMKSALTRFRDLVTSPMISENYCYSVRINEARALPQQINKLGSFHRQKLKKAIISLNINEDYGINDSSCYRMRRLEEELYDNYLPSSFDSEDVITYQWKEEKETNLKGQFNFYFDISRNAVNKSSMFVYMFLLLVLGAAGNAIWDLVKFILGWI